MTYPAKSRVPLVIFCSCVVVLALEAFLFYGKISDAREERDAMEKIAEQQSEKLKALEQEAEHLRIYIDRMLKDPEFAEMEVRRRLGYTQDGEVIIREADPESSRNPLR